MTTECLFVSYGSKCKPIQLCIDFSFDGMYCKCMCRHSPLSNVCVSLVQRFIEPLNNQSVCVIRRLNIHMSTCNMYVTCVPYWYTVALLQ